MVDGGAARGHGERGTELDRRALRTHLVADVHGHAVDATRRSARVAHHGAVHVQVVEREVAVGHLEGQAHEVRHLHLAVADTSVRHHDGTHRARVVVQRTHGSHHVALRTQTRQTVEVTTHAVHHGLAHREGLLLPLARQREETRDEVRALLVRARQQVLRLVVGQVVAVGEGRLGIAERHRRSLDVLQLVLVLALFHEGDGVGHNLARAHHSQGVVAELEQGLHLVRSAVHEIQLDFLVANRDIVVGNLKDAQCAQGSNENEIRVPCAHANVVVVVGVLLCHVSRNRGARPREHVPLAVQRHDHTRLHLGDLVEVRERERVKRFLQVGLFVIQHAFRDLSSHVQTDAAEDEGE